MKRFFVSIFSEGVRTSCFESIVFERNYIDVQTFFSTNFRIFPHEIRKVIFSRTFALFKIMMTSNTFTFSTWNPKIIIKQFQNLGIVCEPHTKKIHNPCDTNFHFWFYQ
jgi:hypothetical protein